ncbi:MAG: hypothetical protein GY839_04875 [candidate division Zixibacteria bacterium]|nr:hypothetical protein [candidate division Zixibacteria bacterium]
MRIQTIAIIIQAIMLISAATAGPDDNSKLSAAESSIETISLDKFSWLAGHWQGDAFGGICQEVWSPPSGGSMVGSFKLINEGSVSFYEIMTIAADSTGLALKLKHFNPDLTGWEEKDDVIRFPFISVSDDEIQFEGLIYKKITEDSLEIILSFKRSDGTVDNETINCHRVK